MIVAGIHFGGLIAFTFFRDNMQKVRPRPTAERAECAFQLFHIVAIHRAKILEPHILEHRGVVHRTAQERFTIGEGIFQGGAHQRDGIQKTAHIILGIHIGGGRTQMGQITGKCTNILRDRHFIVVQDHKQVVQMLDVVHALVDHAAGKGAVADHCHNKPLLMMQLFGPCHANSKRKGCVAMPGNKCIVHTFVRVWKSGNAVQLTKLLKLSAPSCKDLMGVALMAHIEYDLILRGLQHAVQCHCKLYHAKVRRQMSTGFRDVFQQKAADLLTKLFYLLFI